MCPQAQTKILRPDNGIQNNSSQGRLQGCSGLKSLPITPYDVQNRSTFISRTVCASS
jgi:hypothetical protein